MDSEYRCTGQSSTKSGGYHICVPVPSSRVIDFERLRNSHQANAMQANPRKAPPTDIPAIAPVLKARVCEEDVTAEGLVVGGAVEDGLALSDSVATPLRQAVWFEGPGENATVCA